LIGPLPCRLRRAGGYLALLLSLASFTFCCSRAREEPFLLQEGKGWEGKLSLGDPGEKALRLLGKAQKEQEEKSWRYYDYDFAEVMIDTKSGEIASILMRERWRTASGIGAGDPVEKILSVYGQIPYRPPVLSYPERGVSFVLAPSEISLPDGGKRLGWITIWARVYKPER